MLALSISGLVLGIVGSVILAFSLNRLIVELVLCLRLVDTTVGALCTSQDIPRFIGIEQRLDGGIKSAKWRTVLGLSLLALSFAIQLITLFCPKA